MNTSIWGWKGHVLYGQSVRISFFPQSICQYISVWLIRTNALSLCSTLNYDKKPNLHAKNRCKRKNHKFAVFFQQSGQTNEDEILANRHGSKKFAEFMRHLGKRVKLSEHKGYDIEISRFFLIVCLKIFRRPQCQRLRRGIFFVYAIQSTWNNVPCFHYVTY